MGILENVLRMKEEGLSEKEIIKNLRNANIPPKEIADAIDQSNIKDAISGFRQSIGGSKEQITTPRPASQTQPNQEESYSNSQEDIYEPQPQEEQYYQQGQYPQYQYPKYEQSYLNYPESNYDTDSVIDIAEQVFSEKYKDIEKKIGKLEEFKTLINLKIEHIQSNLQKLETIMNKLQVAILEKVGSYTNDISSIKKELEMMENSFSKTLPNLIKKSSSAKKPKSKRKTLSARKKTQAK